MILAADKSVVAKPWQYQSFTEHLVFSTYNEVMTDKVRPLSLSLSLSISVYVCLCDCVFLWRELFVQACVIPKLIPG